MKFAYSVEVLFLHYNYWLVSCAVSDAVDRRLSLSPRQQSGDVTIDLLETLPAGKCCVSVCVCVNIPSKWFFVPAGYFHTCVHVCYSISLSLCTAIPE